MPMTAILTFAPAAAVTGFSGTSANSSTPPIIVMSVAKEPLFRKSRRLNPKGSLSISFIAVNCFLDLSQGDNNKSAPTPTRVQALAGRRQRHFYVGATTQEARTFLSAIYFVTLLFGFASPFSN